MNYFVGDTHTFFQYLNEYLESAKKEDNFFICGDFGYWKKKTFQRYKNQYENPEEFYHETELKNPNGAKIYFCDGNHEDFHLLSLLGESKSPIEVQENLYYCPRGSSLILKDGRKILFFGGASSIDKHLRIKDINWFSEENITYKDYLKLDKEDKYDIIISHTCPSMCLKRMRRYNRWKSGDFNNDVLQSIFDLYQPKKWYFGHWHVEASFTMKKCRFICLNKTSIFGHIKKERK